ncbi:hypothetical protein P7K49_020926 [Saguinus oedipus]|uniref:Uncharacterized protein n=1 Tax=Saguinus oedipus TaxID=9490 RepID=A0ABQ9USV5_SAGOE|nr:hypothetical protein P7K49_020926 [Saguinus oedipus]
MQPGPQIAPNSLNTAPPGPANSTTGAHGQSNNRARPAPRPAGQQALLSNALSHLVLKPKNPGDFIPLKLTIAKLGEERRTLQPQTSARYDYFQGKRRSQAEEVPQRRARTLACGGRKWTPVPKPHHLYTAPGCRSLR